jgi:hypothetical protein
MLASAWVSALGGAAYASLFAFGASLGKRGWGRSVMLAIDWLLGVGSGFGAALTPRAHVRSLLGGSAVMEMSGRVSAACLVLLALAFATAATKRASR